MKKLDNPQCNSNNYFIQDKYHNMIYEMQDDLFILMQEYMQEMPEPLVWHELLRYLTFQIYHKSENHRLAFQTVSKAIDEGIMLHKDLRDEEERILNTKELSNG